ncbi:unnamed protein product [Nezara viridula]|uniref:Uncharacterized protein n=1 Tax=Nezara viridula TaxID=85310 RepID=A0A9P0EHH7_NEZVI|nr:unnamed protein product [Nezara viridula]
MSTSGDVDITQRPSSAALIYSYTDTVRSRSRLGLYVSLSPRFGNISPCPLLGQRILFLKVPQYREIGTANCALATGR